MHTVGDLVHPVWEWHGEGPLFRNVAGLKLRRHKDYDLVGADEEHEVTVPGCAYYKLRVFCEKYQ